ncbi:MAG: carboxynorspermidine decarboxylase [Alistipes sp.]|nr:carboxynorspermidine decarboxylase [Alistipes sp.]
MMRKEDMLGRWDLSKVPTPAYVIHDDMLRLNLAAIDRVRREAGVEIIVALKANATWHIFKRIAAHADGATASSIAEAKLVVEEMGYRAHTYAPVYVEEEIDAILDASSHITFNSLSQLVRYGERARERGVSCGLRVNPEYSTVATDLYNPCIPESRLGVRARDIDVWPEGVEGLHFHSLCESRPADLEATLRAVEERFGRHFDRLRWINFGGGHLLTHKDYDVDHLIDILRSFRQRHPHLRIILEPGSAFTWDTGVLVARVEDIVRNGGRNTLMLNVSFACHMPDCLEMPYKPAIRGMHDATEHETAWWMGGNSCLAGDMYGAWATDDGHTPQVGERIIFRDMIHYTMVKTTMFNGVTHPAIVLYSDERGFETLRTFCYDDYKRRMG